MLGKVAMSKKKEFFIQWHLTDNCDMQCKHCYISPAYKTEFRKEFSTKEVKMVIDQFASLLSRWNMGGEINFSGGNPLMYDHFFEIAEYTTKKGIQVNILGNPSPLFDDRNIRKLKDAGISMYQISIDGLEANHEKVRGDGSYKIAIGGLEKLIKEGIPAVVQSTVTKQNGGDIPQLAELLIKMGVFLYSFARLVPSGKGSQMKEMTFTPNEYREFLYKMHKTYSTLKQENIRFNFTPKDPLWMLLYTELGLIESKDNSCNHICGGCSVGMNGLTIDVDGMVYSCRRLEIPLGNIKEQSLQELFIQSPEMNQERAYEKIEGCGSCKLMNVCRGCRAVAYHTNGSYFSKDPQCWKGTVPIEKNEVNENEKYWL